MKQSLAVSVVKGYAFRVYPTEAQCRQLDTDFFASRWVYNRGLDIISRAYSEHKERLSYVDVSRQLTVFKKREGCAFLRQASNDVLTQALRNLDTAVVNAVSEPRIESSHEIRRRERGIL